jgi:hypothetical protein
VVDPRIAGLVEDEPVHPAWSNRRGVERLMIRSNERIDRCGKGRGQQTNWERLGRWRRLGKPAG